MCRLWTVLLLVFTSGAFGQAAPVDAAHDFDFEFGSWKVHNQYLREKFRDSHEWVEFEARIEVMPLLNGLGNLDRYSAIRNGEKIEGIALRLFNPATQAWSDYWADNRAPGILTPPLVGKFHGDVGEFFGEDELNGTKIRCRYRWILTDRDSPRWEQAFSADGGKTWETNWVMIFTRDDVDSKGTVSHR